MAATGLVPLGEESFMELLGLSQKDFGQIMRVCQRVLVNEETSTADLRHFLVARLQEDQPETADRVKHFSDEQMVEITALLTLVNLDRFNAAFGVGSAGFSEGMVCVSPDRPATNATPANIA